MEIIGRFKYHFKTDFPSRLASAGVAVNQIIWRHDESGAVNLWQVHNCNNFSTALCMDNDFFSVRGPSTRAVALCMDIHVHGAYIHLSLNFLSTKEK